MEICHVRNLYNDTKRRVATARQQCRLGQKDFASETLRSIRAASVIEIIKRCDTSAFPALEMNWSLLEWELSQLEQECHPMSQVDATNEFQRIATQLEIIAGGISKLLTK